MKTALVIYIFCALAGLSLVVISVYVLAGFGWSLLAAGISMLLVSAFIRSGLQYGGYENGGGN